jgi:hypothetical protein
LFGLRILVASGLVCAFGAGAATYPVRASLTIAPAEQQRCLVLDRQSDCGAVEASREAFSGAVERMFAKGAPPDLRLVLSVKGSELVGAQLELYVRIEVLTPDGHHIDDLVAFGAAPLLDRVPDAIAGAQRSAAAAAAADFERVYANATDVGDYLMANHVAPAEQVGVPHRGDKLLTIAAGMGMMQGGGDAAFAVAPNLRVAGSYEWGFLQLSFSRYSSGFTGGQTLGPPQALDASLTTNDVGFEGGFALRLTRSLELRAGPGIHFLFGGASFDNDANTKPSSFSKIAPSVYGSLATSFLAGRKGPRMALGIEARGYFFTTVDLPELLRSVPAANSSVAAFVAFELSWEKEALR